MELIRKPTPQELSTPMLSALPGNNLCPEIERQSGKDYFFVEMRSFVDATIAKGACEDTVENRSRILGVFLKASQTLIFAIMENRVKSC